MAKKKTTQLKILMDRSGMTVDSLSQILHLSSSTIKAWVNGSKEPYEAVLDQLCEALVCTREELLAEPAEEVKPAKTVKKAIPESESEKVAQEPAKEETVPIVKKEAATPKKQKTKTPAPKPETSVTEQVVPAKEEEKSHTKKKSTKNAPAPKTKGTPDAKTIAPAKKVPSEKVHLSEASTALLRSFDPSKALKGKGDLTKDQIESWEKSLEDHFATQAKQMTAIISALAMEAAAPKGTVIERKKLAELMDVAKTASDADIDLVIEMLKRMKPL